MFRTTLNSLLNTWSTKLGRLSGLLLMLSRVVKVALVLWGACLVLSTFYCHSLQRQVGWSRFWATGFCTCSCSKYLGERRKTKCEPLQGITESQQPDAPPWKKKTQGNCVLSHWEWLGSRGSTMSSPSRCLTCRAQHCSHSPAQRSSVFPTSEKHVPREIKYISLEHFSCRAKNPSDSPIDQCDMFITGYCDFHFFQFNY